MSRNAIIRTKTIAFLPTQLGTKKQYLEGYAFKYSERYSLSGLRCRKHVYYGYCI